MKKTDSVRRQTIEAFALGNILISEYPIEKINRTEKQQTPIKTKTTLLPNRSFGLSLSFRVSYSLRLASHFTRG